jgi:hypothetical protein
MAKSKVSPKDTPRQEAVPDLVKFTTPLFKLSVQFYENIKSHKNNLHLLSQLMSVHLFRVHGMMTLPGRCLMHSKK